MNKCLIVFNFLVISCLGSFFYAQDSTYKESLQDELSISGDLPINEKIDSLRKLFKHYENEENYTKALKYKLQEMELHKELGSDSLVAYTQSEIGNNFYKTGSYGYASDYLTKALSFFEDDEESLIAAMIRGNLANVYTHIDNYEKAIDYLLKSKKVYENVENIDKNSLAGVYTNLGLAFTGNEEYEQAMKYYNKALSLIEGKKNYSYEAAIFNNIGEVQFKMNELSKAKNYYDKALKLYSKIDNSKGIGTALTNLAKTHLAKESYEDAISIAEKALEYLEKSNDLVSKVEALEHLSIANKEIGNHQAAFNYIKKHYEQKEKLKGSQVTKHIANLELQNTIRKEEERFLLLKQESELREQKLQIKQFRLWLTIIGILSLFLTSIFILLILRYRIQRNKLKLSILKNERENLKNIINFKEEEIEKFALHINEKNNLLDKLKKEISNIKKRTNLDSSELNELTNIVHHSLFIDKNRKELELKINQTHQEFIYRLKQKHPKLTKTEIRLCSFLKLDLSTKEIAAIMNIEPSSVKTARNRLRKKLGLPPKSNLQKILDKI